MYQSRIRFVKRGDRDDYLRVLFTIHSMQRSNQRIISDDDIIDDISFVMNDLENVPFGEKFAIVNEKCKRVSICKKYTVKNSVEIRIVTIIDTDHPSAKNAIVLYSYAEPRNSDEEVEEMPEKFIDLVKKINYDHDINHKKYEAIANKYHVSQALVVATVNRRGLRVTPHQVKDLVYECLNLGAEEKHIKNIANLKASELKRYIKEYYNERREANNIKEEDVSDIIEETKIDNVTPIEKKEEGKTVATTLKGFDGLKEALAQNTKDIEQKENNNFFIHDSDDKNTHSNTIKDIATIDPAIQKQFEENNKIENKIEEDKDVNNNKFKVNVRKPYPMLKDIFNISEGNDKYIDPRKALRCMQIFEILMKRDCSVDEIESLAR